jgi:uncharacterized protein YydD (DUF2326 family)
MENTMLIEVTNQKAVGLLHELEELHLIKVLQKNTVINKQKLSEKYAGILTAEEADKFQDYLKQARSEWDRNF